MFQSSQPTSSTTLLTSPKPKSFTPWSWARNTTTSSKVFAPWTGNSRLDPKSFTPWEGLGSKTIGITSKEFSPWQGNTVTSIESNATFTPWSGIASQTTHVSNKPNIYLPWSGITSRSDPTRSPRRIPPADPVHDFIPSQPDVRPIDEEATKLQELIGRALLADAAGVKLFSEAIHEGILTGGSAGQSWGKLEDENLVVHPLGTETLSDTKMILSIELSWAAPQDLLLDEQLFENIKNAGIALPTDSGALFDQYKSPRRHHRLVFEPRDMHIMANPVAPLNDTCLNGCSEILQLEQESNIETSGSPERCSLFSTYDLARWRSKRDILSDSELQLDVWKNARRTSFWKTDIWIVPIHRPFHWVLCIAYPKKGEICFFDSFSEQSSCEADLRDLSAYFSQLINSAKKEGFLSNISDAPWFAYPAFTKTVQFNSHDCGLWVLVWIAARLRGFHSVAGLNERDMKAWRYSLLQTITRNTVTCFSHSTQGYGDL